MYEKNKQANQPVTENPTTQATSTAQTANSTNQATSTTQAANSPTAGWKTYTNTTYEFTFQYPQDWQAIPSTSYPAPLSENNILYVKTMPGNQTLQEYLDSVDAQVVEDGPAISVDWSKNITVGGLSAVEREETSNTAGFSAGSTYFERNGTIFVLSISGRDKEYTPDDVAHYEQILSTFKFKQ